MKPDSSRREQREGTHTDIHKDPAVHMKQTARAASSMYRCETGLHGLTREKQNSSNTAKEHTNEGQRDTGHALKVLKKGETSLYETDTKSHQTCTRMKQMYSCTDIHKDPAVHMKQTARAASPCTSFETGLHGLTRENK